ncbi:hypothetical protein [Larkinella sp.]|uniref:hypothetical protein n=1 Tax=Larkinella sp. TaxID=2034517 RepID=UPI003BA93B1C
MTTASITISPAPPLQPASDYAALREAGLAYIERYANANWTDYNTHDPGITLLELLCYAITDLSLRTSLDMKDLLASSFGSGDAMQASFVTAGKALPTSPVSDLDYRKLFIDIDGVRNAWIESASPTVFVNCQAKNGEVQLSYHPFPAVLPNHQTSFALKGLYDIQVDFDAFFIQQQVRTGAFADEDTGRQAVLKQVRETYLANRNLCEDVMTIGAVPVQYVMFCADIGLDNEANVSEVYAEILFQVQNYLAPPVRRYSLAERQNHIDAAGNRLTTDQIFDGPRLVNGFIDDDELAQSERRSRVYASDLINLMMRVKGVKDVRKVLMNKWKAGDACLNGPPLANGEQRWCLHIDPLHQPQLCAENVALSFFKDIIPVGSLRDKTAALSRFQELQEKAYRENRKTVDDLPVPTGELYDLKAYSSIANDLPQNYGVGRFGLPASASAERRAQARQLKGYLLFFDQMLANYQAQLANLKSFFSADQDVRTYFGQAVTDLAGIDELYVDPAGLPDTIDTVLAKLENFEDNPVRKNRFLDHLLARFAENFNDYALLMHSLFGERGSEEILEDKVHFIREYGEVFRSKAYTYCKPAWETENVAGITRRLARLTGIRGNNYQTYAASSVTVMTALPSVDNPALFRFQLESPENDTQYLISTNEFDNLALAEKAMKTAFQKVPAKGRFRMETVDNRFTYALLDAVNQPIARCPRTFPTRKGADQDLETALETLIYSGEALFLVEHGLLRPATDPSDAWMAVCVEPGCDHCEPLDPYSYRVSIVLPGYTMRFRNIDYRRYIENLIRSELPAHVLARICWVSREQLHHFEAVYQPWLDAQMATCADPTLTNDKTKALIERLEHPDFHTIYETGVLHDCDNEDEETPIILNRTALGTLPLSKPEDPPTPDS